MIGAGWIFIQGAIHETVVGSGPFEAFATGLLGLVHYRQMVMLPIRIAPYRIFK